MFVTAVRRKCGARFASWNVKSIGKEMSAVIETARSMCVGNASKHWKCGMKPHCLHVVQMVAALNAKCSGDQFEMLKTQQSVGYLSDDEGCIKTPDSACDLSDVDCDYSDADY